MDVPNQYQHPDDQLQQKKQKPKWKIWIIKLLDHPFTALFMTIIAVYSLFFDDIRSLALDPKWDELCFGITTACMFLFSLEIVLASIAKDDYFLGFFFWLDVISTLSMIPDIGWIWNAITGGGKGVQNAGQLAKTSRASRITRVIRVIRLIRLIRIVKLYKQAKHA